MRILLVFQRRRTTSIPVANRRPSTPPARARRATGLQHHHQREALPDLMHCGLPDLERLLFDAVGTAASREHAEDDAQGDIHPEHDQRRGDRPEIARGVTTSR